MGFAFFFRSYHRPNFLACNYRRLSPFSDPFDNTNSRQVLLPGGILSFFMPILMMIPVYWLFQQIADTIYQEFESKMVDVVQIYGIPRKAYWLSYGFFWMLIFACFISLAQAIGWFVFPLFTNSPMDNRFRADSRPNSFPLKDRAPVSVSMFPETAFVAFLVLGSMAALSVVALAAVVAYTAPTRDVMQQRKTLIFIFGGILMPFLFAGRWTVFKDMQGWVSVGIFSKKRVPKTVLGIGISRILAS